MKEHLASRRSFLKQLSLTSLALIPGINVLADLIDAEVTSDKESYIPPYNLVDCAYRLMHYKTMLELEFYFLNVRVESKSTEDLTPKCLHPIASRESRFKSYMVVRLPQQHISEQYISSVDIRDKQDGSLKDTCETRISGYSYLCFRIDFHTLDGSLPISAEAFMDWNAKHFSLVSKPDNDVRPFIAVPEESNSLFGAPAKYPLSFDRNGGGINPPIYRRTHYPNERVHEHSLKTNQLERMRKIRDFAPFTALEIPYRLIISPRLPSWEYTYTWVFTAYIAGNSPHADSEEHAQLWMATLSLKKKEAQAVDIVSDTEKKEEEKTGEARGDAPQGQEELINKADNQLQLMILGPLAVDEPEGEIDILPNKRDKDDLVALFRDFNLHATTPSLTFTPLGVCTQIAFHNKYFERDRISLYQWKQAISFGRDQEVEVSNIVVDATFGLKMLHVRTTRRETTYGRAVLIYREFLMPLEPEKDFASSKVGEGSDYQREQHKYASPFKNVRFADLNPRQILPLDDLGDDVSVAATNNNDREGSDTLKFQKEAQDRIKEQDKKHAKDPKRDVLAFWAITPDRKMLEWPMIVTDWADKKHTLQRRLYVLKSELYLDQKKDYSPVYSVDDVPTIADDIKKATAFLIDNIGQKLDEEKIKKLPDSIKNELKKFGTSIAIGNKLTSSAQISAEIQKITHSISVRDVPTIEGDRNTAKALLNRYIGQELDLKKIAELPESIKKELDKFSTIAVGKTLSSIDEILVEFKKTTHTVADSAGQKWKEVLRQSEDFELALTDTLRESLTASIANIEQTIVRICNQGERDIEDQVMEQWKLFKRKAMQPIQSLESQLYSLKQMADRLLMTVNQWDGSSTIRENVKKAIDTFKTGVEKNLNDLRAAADKNFSAERLLSLIKDANIPVAITSLLSTVTTLLSGIPPEVNKIFSDFNALRDDLKKRAELLEKIQSDAIGFTYELNIFLRQVPRQIANELRNNAEIELSKLRDAYGNLKDIESNLKTRIEGAKSNITYVVNQVEDEMEVFKKALDKKLRESYTEFQDAPSEILRKTKEWLDYYERLGKDFNDAVNGRMAAMQTDYLIFRNNIRFKANEAKQKAFDFFNPYACYPQLHDAQVYAARVNELVRSEIPLKIKYAEDYLKNQVDNYAMEVTNNASRVFAEVKGEAQEWLKGAMREAGKELGGLVNPELAADYLTLLKDRSKRAEKALQETIDGTIQVTQELQQQLQREKDLILETANKDVNDLLQNALNGLGPRELEKARNEFNQMRNSLLTLSKEAKDTLKAAEEDVKVQAQAFFKGLEAKILGSIRIKDLLGIDFDLPKLIQHRDKVVYKLITNKFKPLDLKVFRFIPRTLDGQTTVLSTYLEVPFKNPGDFHSVTQLSNFTVGIFADRLQIGFKRIELLSDKNKKNKVNVELGQIAFSKELEFLAKFTEGFQIPGTGLTITPSPKDVAISYALPIPGISSGAFTFDNLKFVAGVVIPLPTGIGNTNEPVAIKLGVNTPADPFAIGVLIFGGMGSFSIETTPKYIRKVDISMSFGGLFRINLVIATGQAYLQAGIRYIYTRSPLGEPSMELYALITCGANVTVFGFIDVSVMFIMYLKYKKDRNGSSLYGVASVSYSVRIGFFTKSFTLTFSQRIAGAESKENETVFQPHPSDSNIPGRWRENDDSYYAYQNDEQLHLNDDGIWQAERAPSGLNISFCIRAT